MKSVISLMILVLILSGCCFSDPYRDEKVCHIEYGELVGPAGVEPYVSWFKAKRPSVERQPRMRIYLVGMDKLELSST